MNSLHRLGIPVVEWKDILRTSDDSVLVGLGQARESRQDPHVIANRQAEPTRRAGVNVCESVIVRLQDLVVGQTHEIVWVNFGDEGVQLNVDFGDCAIGLGPSFDLEVTKEEPPVPAAVGDFNVASSGV